MLRTPAWYALAKLEDRLLNAGILNHKDMPPFAGNETGTISERLLNVWHWDAMLFLMMAALPCLTLGILLLWSGRLTATREVAS